jgi:hypothetical protein
MAKELTAQSDIPATPGRVWEVLTDLAAYRTWNPFILRPGRFPDDGMTEHAWQAGIFCDAAPGVSPATQESAHARSGGADVDPVAPRGREHRCRLPRMPVGVSSEASLDQPLVGSS